MTLRGTSYTTNNSVVPLVDIEDTENALTCVSDLAGCCLNPNIGEWHYPNQTLVPTNNAIFGFYRNRGMAGQVFLRRRPSVLSPGGTYCCEVPTTSGGTDVETFCVFLQGQ